MILLNWYREWLNIRYESSQRKIGLTRDVKICESCETLKHQLELANYEKQKLLDRLLEKSAPESVKQESNPISVPRNIPWNVRRQMLEREDREKARLLREAVKPDSKNSIEELEKEMDVASEEREQQGS